MASEILERLAQMERKVLEVIYGPSAHSRTGVVADAIHRHTMLIARKVCLDDMREHARQIGLGKLFNQEAARVAVNERFPLPPKRVLREEPDPNGAALRWRYGEAGVEHQAGSDRVWRGLDSVGLFTPTGERIDLWHSLKHEPYREVPDNGDE